MRGEWMRWAGAWLGGRSGHSWHGGQGHGPGGPGAFGGWGGPGRPRGRGGPWGDWGRGRWGPGRDGGWEPGRWRGRMERGVLRYLLLAALRDGPKHGYQLIKWLEERTFGFYSPSPGTIYPTLQFLEDQGLVRAESQDERRVYRLTEAGRAELEAHGGMVEAVFNRFSRHAPSGAGQHEVAFLKTELQDLVRTVQEGLGGPLRQVDEETVRRVRQAVERCKNEVRDVIARAPAAAPGGAGAPDAPGGQEGPSAPGDDEAPTRL